MDEPGIVRRKDEHIDLALQQADGAAASPFEGWRLEPCALPEMRLEEVSIETDFLGRTLQAPFLISSMTGGPARSAEINANLAVAAETVGVALAVGSQRVALEGAAQNGLGRRLRDLAPSILLLGNLGGAQLALGYGVDEGRRAMEMIGADGLIVHLNPLQEAVQPGGDRDWRGVLAGIETLARDLGAPVIVKEVGFGVSGAVARRLRDAGAAAIDVAGAGGTDWAVIEAGRGRSDMDRRVAEAFRGWGLATPEALLQVREACPELPLIGSGGIRNGVDAAKAIRLGADLVGQAGAVLKAALQSPEAVVSHFEVMARQLRVACFATGAATLADLRRVPIARA